MQCNQQNLFSLKHSRISAVLFCCVLFLTACDEKKELLVTPPKEEQKQTEPARDGKLLRRALYSALTLHSPEIKNSDQMHILRDLSEGLVMLDRAGNVVPAVAEQWQSDDFKSWIFVFRSDLKWSNGEKLSAHDFVRSWQQLALSDNPLKQYLTFLNLENAQAVLGQSVPVERLGVSALDDRTLSIRLDKAVPYLPQMLAHVALLPQYLSPQRNTNQTPQFIGNGAYRLRQQQADLFMLEKNPFYWNPTQAAFEQVSYQQIKPNQSVDKLDWVDNPPFKNERVMYFPRLCTYFYEFNFKDPLLKQNAVRSALASMISVPDIVRNDKSMLPNSVNFLPQNMQFEQEREWQPTLVEQLLLQNGVTETNPLQLTLSYDNQGVHPLIADWLIRAWSQSDLIRIKPEALSHKQLLEKRAAGDFQLIRSGWCADYNDPSAFLNLLYSMSPDNKSAFSHENIDKLLEQTLSPEISAQERTALYQQVTLLVQQEKAVLPIFQYMKPVYVHDSLAGYDMNNPTEVIYSKDLFRQPQTKPTDTAQ